MSAYFDSDIGANTRYFNASGFGLVRKNFTFSGTKFNLNGVQSKTVFSSLDKLNQNDLDKFAQIVKKNLNLDKIKTSSSLSKNYEFQNEVSFKDSISGNTINLKLSQDNLDKLKMYFGSQNLSLKDGKILLSGEAEKFVSGWFGDIAYKRNYIGADSDKNGFLNDEEKALTYAGYSSENSIALSAKLPSNVASVDFHGVSSYLAYNKHYDAQLQNTIEKELNATLKADVNMDGYLSLGELQSKESIIALAKKNIEGKSRGLVNFDIDEVLKMLQKENEKPQKNLDIEAKKQLNAEQYASSEEYFTALKEEIKSITKLSLSLKISQNLIIDNLDNPNFNDDIRGLITQITQITQSTQSSLSLDLLV